MSCSKKEEFNLIDKLISYRVKGIILLSHMLTSDEIYYAQFWLRIIYHDLKI